jgi:hypothetical protein
MQGRSTFSNIRSTLDAIQQAKTKNSHGILAFIDYEKAFDLVGCHFMFRCLENINFGNYYRQCIQTLYN